VFAIIEVDEWLFYPIYALGLARTTFEEMLHAIISAYYILALMELIGVT
jgi:hypothetical protein